MVLFFHLQITDTTMAHKRIDILMMGGSRGGFENIVNQTAVYLTQNGFQIRYVQLLAPDAAWEAPEVSSCCLELDRDNVSLEEARVSYAALLQADSIKPSLIFATGWPYLIYVSKGASSDAAAQIPVVAWPHDDLQYYEEGGSGDISLFQYADICFAINNKIAQDLYNAYPEKPIYRTYNSFDPARVRYSEDRNTQKLAYVGRLSDKKVIPIILYALERTKAPWRLMLAGGGEEESSLRKLASELHLKDRVSFLGWQEDPFSSVTDCRALVMSSIYEGAPLTVLEALASGMQLISTPVGNVEEILSDPVCGEIVPFGDPDALATALDRLIDTPFTPDIAAACKALTADYLPENTLYDFLRKTEACIQLMLLPEHYTPENRCLYIRRNPL